ncbi:MAG: MFS transporter [Candidatus Binatia bacterium]
MPSRPPLFSGAFVLVMAANFFFFLNFASYFLLPLHIRALGGGESVIGAVMGCAGLASLIVLPLVGLSIDRFGRRLFLVLGACGMTAASAGFLYVDRVGPLLFALRMLQGVAFAAAFTASTTFAAELAPRSRRAQALGLFGLSTLLTHAIAPILGEEIVHRGGFDALFVVTMAYTLIVLGLSFGLPAPGTARGAGASHAQRRLRPIHWMVGGTMTLAGMGFGTVMTFIPTYVTSEQFGRVGFFFLAYTGSAILTRMVGAGLSDRLGRRRVIVPTLLALGVSIGALAFVHSRPALFAAGLLFGTAQGLSYPTLHAFLVDLVSDAQLGRSQALFNGAFSLGVTSSAFAFGVVAEHWGYRPMFVLAALTPIAACALFAFGTGAALTEPVPP